MNIDPKDLMWESFRFGVLSPKTQAIERSVKVTHLPTGTVVYADEERSEYKNREIALEKLINKLKEIKYEKLGD